MRIILKPGGIALLAGCAVAVIAGLAMPNRHAAGSNATNAVFPGAASAATLTFSGGGTPGPTEIPLSDRGWHYYTEAGAAATYAPRAPGGPTGVPYQHFEVRALGHDPWNIGLNQGLGNTALPAGATIRLQFTARSSASSQVCVLLQQNAPPYSHAWKEYVTLTPTWKPYDFTFRSGEYPKNTALLSFFLGYSVGTVDIASVRLQRV
jgi:hypothetical protein